MVGITKHATIDEFQEFNNKVYRRPNDLHFSLSDMLNNIQRFAMRGIKGIRKGDKERTRLNLLISLSWFVSTLNRLHIDLEDILWNRFPYLCSYCGSAPCSCAKKKPDERPDLIPDLNKRPKTIKDYQQMFEEIYPSDNRTLEHAGVHLAEEIGELSEALLAYRGEHKDELLQNIAEEAADAFSCFMGVFNSWNIDAAEELANMFDNNCHECNKAPCKCTFNKVINYNS